ncbi:hypothetical protein, partial [Methanomethylovorans sp.]|uniref:hypothetical protein n=1 Tax=Methanomethylovorans sp. TaxID=2758717 RepID=UPI001BD223BF
KNAAAALTEAEYTPSTWSDLTTALALAETTNAEVIAKTTAINAAIAKLITKAAYDDLTDAMNEASELNEEDYTEDTWAVLADAIELSETTNDEVVYKTTAINAAIAKLITKAAYDDLTDAKNAALELNQADYTEDTWAVLADAIELSETTNDEVVYKTTAINDAIDGLIVVGLTMPVIPIDSIPGNTSVSSDIIDLSDFASEEFIQETGVEGYEYIVTTSGNSTIPVNVNVHISTIQPEDVDDISDFDESALPDFYYHISVNNSVWYDNISQIQLRIYYNRSVIQALDIEESKLRLVRYTNGTWIKLDKPGTLADGTILYSSGVNMDEDHPYVWANLSRFSNYGVAGTLTEIQSSTSGKSKGKAIIKDNVAVSVTDLVTDSTSESVDIPINDKVAESEHEKEKVVETEIPLETASTSEVKGTPGFGVWVTAGMFVTALIFARRKD